MKNKTTVLFIVIAVLCLALGVVAVIVMRNYVPDIKGTSGADDSAKARIRCEEVVRASLLKPDQAKFRSQKVTALGDNRFQVVGTLDAPNATGINVRGSYDCIFNFNTKLFDLLSLDPPEIWKPLNK